MLNLLFKLTIILALQTLSLFMHGEKLNAFGDYRVDNVRFDIFYYRFTNNLPALILYDMIVALVPCFILSNKIIFYIILNSIPISFDMFLYKNKKNIADSFWFVPNETKIISFGIFTMITLALSLFITVWFILSGSTLA